MCQPSGGTKCKIHHMLFCAILLVMLCEPPFVWLTMHCYYHTSTNGISLENKSTRDLFANKVPSCLCSTSDWCQELRISGWFGPVELAKRPGRRTKYKHIHKHTESRYSNKGQADSMALRAINEQVACLFCDSISELKVSSQFCAKKIFFYNLNVFFLHSFQYGFISRRMYYAVSLNVLGLLSYLLRYVFQIGQIKSFLL